MQTGAYPLMSPCGTRVMLPPVKPSSDTNGASFSGSVSQESISRPSAGNDNSMTGASPVGRNAVRLDKYQPWEGEDANG